MSAGPQNRPPDLIARIAGSAWRVGRKAAVSAPLSQLLRDGWYQVLRQAQRVVGLLSTMRAAGVAEVDCKPDVFAEYVRRVDEAHANMVWTHPGMSTYYRNRHGRVVTNLPWRAVYSWRMTREPDLDDFRVEPAASEPSLARPT